MKTFIRAAVSIFFLLSIFSCEISNEALFTESETHYYSGEYEADINNDGFADIKMDIEYYVFSDRNLTYYYIKSVNGTQFCFNGDGEPHLYFKYDLIPFKPENSLYWSGKKANIMHCNYYRKNWRGDWAGKTAYLGLKLGADSSAYCAWINITADTLRESRVVFNYSRIQNLPQVDFRIE